MKLIPITNARTWKSEYVFKKCVNFKKKRMEMNIFMKTLGHLLSCLSVNPEDKTLYKLVLKENHGRAITGDPTALQIDYSRLIVSKGKLPMPKGLSAMSQEPGKLLFVWNDNSASRGTRKSDYLFVALFHRASQKWHFELNAALRSDCEFKMNSPSLEGQTVHIYAGFVSQDRQRVSTSVYLGERQIMRIGSFLRA